MLTALVHAMFLKSAMADLAFFSWEDRTLLKLHLLLLLLLNLVASSGAATHRLLRTNVKRRGRVEGAGAG